MNVVMEEEADRAKAVHKSWPAFHKSSFSI